MEGWASKNDTKNSKNRLHRLLLSDQLMTHEDDDFWLVSETVSSFDLLSETVDEFASSSNDEPSEELSCELEFDWNWLKCEPDWLALSKLELSVRVLTAGLAVGGGVTFRCLVASNLFKTATCDWHATTISGL